MSLKDAWAEFDKAVSMDEKAHDSTKTDGLRRMATKGCDKHLDKAVALEAEAIEKGERHGE